MVVKNKGLYLGIIKKQTIINNKSKSIIMTTTQLIYSDLNKAIKTLITNEALDIKHAQLEKEYLKGNLAPTSLDRQEAAKAALIDMMFDGDFRK